MSCDSMGKVNKRNWVQVVAGSNPVAPTNYTKGLPVFTSSPFLLLFLPLPTLSPLITVKALPCLCFPCQVLQYARYVKPSFNKGYEGFYYLQTFGFELAASKIRF